MSVTLDPSMRESARARIRRNSAEDENGCWTWQRSKSRDGYGWSSVGDSTIQAHRLSYQAFVGPIPEGKQIDHLCRNRACVNPEHLEPVTNRENQLRGDTWAAAHVAKTCCPKCGGPYEPKWNATLNSWGRFCRPCANAKRNERLRRIRAERRSAA